MKTIIHRYCHQLLMSAIWRRWVRTNDYTLSSVICHGIYMFSVQVQVQILYKSSSIHVCCSQALLIVSLSFRSASAGKYVVSDTCLAFGRLSFTVAGPSICDSYTFSCP